MFLTCSSNIPSCSPKSALPVYVVPHLCSCHTWSPLYSPSCPRLVPMSSTFPLLVSRRNSLAGLPPNTCLQLPLLHRPSSQTPCQVLLVAASIHSLLLLWPQASWQPVNSRSLSRPSRQRHTPNPSATFPWGTPPMGEPLQQHLSTKSCSPTPQRYPAPLQISQPQTPGCLHLSSGGTLLPPSQPSEPLSSSLTPTTTVPVS